MEHSLEAKYHNLEGQNFQFRLQELPIYVTTDLIELDYQIWKQWVRELELQNY